MIVEIDTDVLSEQSLNANQLLFLQLIIANNDILITELFEQDIITKTIIEELITKKYIHNMNPPNELDFTKLVAEHSLG